MELGFASLHQLARHCSIGSRDYPFRSARRWRSVFGLSAGPPRIGSWSPGMLSLFSEVAEERPLLCSSMTHSGSIRPRRSPWLLWPAACWPIRSGLCSPRGRGGRGILVDFRRLEVRGVRTGDARTLLESALGSHRCASRDRIVAETRGNPLALLELPRGLTATRLAGGFGLTEAQALSGRIEDSFVRRLTRCPTTRAACSGGSRGAVGDPFLLRPRSRGDSASTPRPHPPRNGGARAGRAGDIPHPLVRSAVYRSAAAQDRRRSIVRWRR